MKMRLASLALLAPAAMLPFTAPAGAAASPNFIITQAVRHDLSPPLRDMKPAFVPGTLHTIPLRSIPLPKGTRNGPDGALQLHAPVKVGTTDLLKFPGVGQGDYGFNDSVAPPDTNGAVGATQYVQWVNESFAVFNKSTGALIMGPVAGNTLWSGFGGVCQSQNDGDIIAQYDKLAGRWVMAQPVFSAPYTYCVAISKTSDATGAYYRYAFTYGNSDFIDYPKLGVWPDAYYTTYNIFLNGSSFIGAMLCALDRNSMLTGAAATQQCFQLSSQYGGVLPSDVDGTTAPPVGATNYLVNFGSNSLNEWQFHVDWSVPTNTKLTGPIHISVPSFSAACGGGTCIPQKATTQKLDSLADRLMYRLAYRNFGTHESLVVDHSVTASGGRAGVRWYELRTPVTPTLFQSGTFAPGAAVYRWMGSIAMDKAGDMAVGYSASDGAIFPSVRYTGRLSTDTLGTMEGEKVVKAGGGSQTGSLSRWGDYSAMSVDPVDDCTFYYTTEYLKSSGSFNWSTEINSFKFPNC